MLNFYMLAKQESLTRDKSTGIFYSLGVRYANISSFLIKCQNKLECLLLTRLARLARLTRLTRD